MAKYCDMYDGWYSMALSSKLCTHAMVKGFVGYWEERGGSKDRALLV